MLFKYKSIVQLTTKIEADTPANIHHKKRYRDYITIIQ